MQQFLFWRQDLTGFHKYRHLRPYSSLGNCVEQQALGKNLSGLIIPGIAETNATRFNDTTLLWAGQWHFCPSVFGLDFAP